MSIADVTSTSVSNYKTELLENRIKLITYIDTENSNVVYIYISYDIYKLESLGITSQHIQK